MHKLEINFLIILEETPLQNESTTFCSLGLVGNQIKLNVFCEIDFIYRVNMKFAH